VDFETRPQPEPEGEEALTVALERLLAGDVLPEPYRSRWRAEGITENVGGETAYATPPPRGGK
jgi:hypothetical protein